MANFIVKTLDKIQTDVGLVNTSYQWILSENGTNEYYLVASGGGDPNLSKPFRVLENNSYMTEGTIGSLTAGEWSYGDNDSLGFSTIYVRLSDNIDPDDKTTDYVVARYLYNYIEFDNQTMILQILISNDNLDNNTVTVELTDDSNNVLSSLYLVSFDSSDTFSDTCKIIIPAEYKLLIRATQPSISIYLAGVEV